MQISENPFALDLCASFIIQQVWTWDTSLTNIIHSALLYSIEIRHQTGYLCIVRPFRPLETNKWYIESNSLSTPSRIGSDQDNGCSEIYLLSFSLRVSWIIKLSEMGLSGLNLTDWWHKARLCLSFSDGGMGLGCVLSCSLKISLDFVMIFVQRDMVYISTIYLYLCYV